MVSPQYQEELKEILDAKHVPYHVMIEDVQALVDSQLKGVDTAADFDYTKYHTYAEVGFFPLFVLKFSCRAYQLFYCVVSYHPLFK